MSTFTIKKYHDIIPNRMAVFFTATVLDWKPLLREDKAKEIIIDSLRFMVKGKRIKLTAFVLMNTHIHFVWQPLAGYIKQNIQLQFMKYTAQQLKFYLQTNDTKFLKDFYVNKKDRQFQFWKRNSLSIELFTEEVFFQKIEYIHMNPVKAGLCRFPEEYKYSSARYYYDGVDEFGLFV